MGYGDPGQLTEPVRTQPWTVILLDEIEKAHEEIFNILLQLLDDGRLTDGQNRVVDFSNTIVIMTSNVGTKHVTNEGITQETIVKIGEALRAKFRPEFLNRIDEIVVFNSLTKQNIRKIVGIQLGKLETRLLSKIRGVKLRLTQDAMEALVEGGFHPEYGARPLKRVIKRFLAGPLSKYILEGKITEGVTVQVNFIPDPEDRGLGDLQTKAKFTFIVEGQE